MSAIFFAFRKVGFAFYLGCMGNSRIYFFPLLMIPVGGIKKTPEN